MRAPSSWERSWSTSHPRRRTRSPRTCAGRCPCSLQRKDIPTSRSSTAPSGSSLPATAASRCRVGSCSWSGATSRTSSRRSCSASWRRPDLPHRLWPRLQCCGRTGDAAPLWLTRLHCPRGHQAEPIWPESGLLQRRRAALLHRQQHAAICLLKRYVGLAEDHGLPGGLRHESGLPEDQLRLPEHDPDAPPVESFVAAERAGCAVPPVDHRWGA
mmetsp:Transcript_3121/g.9360  ORF Transcript_3121/g.9360 Transcript_3121/m.9360 type:complete len:214 (+) Transcript_3121:176-817(+)